MTVTEDHTGVFSEGWIVRFITHHPIIQALVHLCGINDETGSWHGLLSPGELLYLPTVAQGTN